MISLPIGRKRTQHHFGALKIRFFRASKARRVAANVAARAYFNYYWFDFDARFLPKADTSLRGRLFAARKDYNPELQAGPHLWMRQR